MSRRYDQRTTTFTPDGRLQQIEYAVEAINKTGSSIGINLITQGLSPRKESSLPPRSTRPPSSSRRARSPRRSTPLISISTPWSRDSPPTPTISSICSGSTRRYHRPHSGPQAQVQIHHPNRGNRCLHLRYQAVLHPNRRIQAFRSGLPLRRLRQARQVPALLH